MGGRPLLLAGGLQITDRLVVDRLETEGAAGASGGSFASVTLMVTIIAVLAPPGSLTFTVTK